jgi:integrase
MTTTALATRPEVLPAATLPPDRNPVAVYLARLAPGSRRTMAEALETIAGMLTAGRLTAAEVSWGALRYSHTAAIRTALAERYARTTANKHLCALRGVLLEARRLGLICGDDYAQAVDIHDLKGETLPRGRALEVGELRALFAACDSSPAGARDAALLAVCYGGGLRRAEVVALDLSDYDPATGALTVRAGKGRKDRTSYATNGAAAALAAWLAVRGPVPGPLFVPVNRAGRVEVRGMTPQAVYLALRKRAELAGVARFSPHDLRRTFVGDLLDAGADIATVQRLAGHASVQTTARYDRRGEATKRRAAELLHVPYRRR